MEQNFLMITLGVIGVLTMPAFSKDRLAATLFHQAANFRLVFSSSSSKRIIPNLWDRDQTMRSKKGKTLQANTWRPHPPECNWDRRESRPRLAFPRDGRAPRSPFRTTIPLPSLDWKRFPAAAPSVRSFPEWQPPGQDGRLSSSPIVRWLTWVCADQWPPSPCWRRAWSPWWASQLAPPCSEDPQAQAPAPEAHLAEASLYCLPKHTYQTSVL